MVHWLPENIASYGVKFDAVISNIYYIVGAWLILAEFILFYFIFRYRRSSGRKAAYVPGLSLKSLAWVLVPAFLVLGFDLAMDFNQHEVWKEAKETLPPADQVVKVNARQFVWEFIYPGRDGKLNTPDDILTTNQLYVPVNAVVQLQLESADVIHSFFVPSLRFKQDVVPGRTIQGWFKAIKTGNYQLVCAELCGIGHGNMGGLVHVLSPEDYRKWLNEKTAEAHPSDR